MVTGVWDLKLLVWRKKWEESRAQVPNDLFLSETGATLTWLSTGAKTPADR